MSSLSQYHVRPRPAILPWHFAACKKSRDLIANMASDARKVGFYRRGKSHLAHQGFGIVPGEITHFKLIVPDTTPSAQCFTSESVLTKFAWFSSLSIRSNQSQQDIFKQLKKLKNIIETSRCATSEPTSNLLMNTSHKRLLTNQRELMRAAQSFYSSASSTASTSEGTMESSQVTPNQPSTRVAAWSVVGSDIGSLTSQTRRRIEDFIRNNGRSAVVTSISGSIQATHHAANANVRESVQIRGVPPQRLTDLSIDDVPVNELSLKSGFDTNYFLYTGLRQLAEVSIRSHEFTKAEVVLRQALRQGKSLSQEDPYQVRMRLQLVLIGFLQGKGRDMEASVLDLVKFHVKQAIANQLLYILVLAHVLEKDHDASKRLLPELLRASSTPGSITSPTKVETMQLWAASCRLAGDDYEGEAIEVMCPALKEKALPTVSGFILDSEELLLELMGPSQEFHVRFKSELVTAEKERLRHSPRALFKIRWLQVRPNYTAGDGGSPPIDSIADNGTESGSESESDNEICEDKTSSSKDSMNLHDLSRKYKPKQVGIRPSKWWRKAKSVGRYFKNIRKTFLRIKINVWPTNCEPESVHEPIPFLIRMRHALGNEKYDQIMSQGLEDRNTDYAPAPLPRTKRMGSETVRRLSFEGEPRTPNLLPAELADTGLLPELADTGLLPELADTRLSLAKIIEMDTCFNKCTKTSQETGKLRQSTPVAVRAPNGDHGNILHNLVRTPTFLCGLLYDPPTITQTLADYLATLRLEQTLSQYPAPVQVDKAPQSRTPDSGYVSTPNVYPGDPRHIPHEKHLRSLLGLKISIPVLFLRSGFGMGLKDIKPSKLARRKSVFMESQGNLAEDPDEINVSREAKTSREVTCETDPRIAHIVTSDIHGAVAVDEPPISRLESSSTKKLSQIAEDEPEQAVDNYRFGNFSWKLPDEDHIYERQKRSVEQEKHGPHITHQKDIRWLMSGALRKVATSSAYTSHVRYR
ncbi:hypothetical protein G7054_g15142 [Neopestalotiopsis clavispora]|nr:hypothetical protein G7054_g15142 [Neopestalotiopsis clavispora]